MNSKKEKDFKELSLGVLARVRRTPYQSAAAVLVTALTLFTAGMVTMFGLGSTVVLRHFETRPQVVAFFKPEVTLSETQIENLRARLLATGKVATVKYISKDEALTIYQDLFKDDPVLLELATAKMLPATVKVSSTDPKYLPDINDVLKKEPGIYLVDFQKDVVTALTRWTDTIRKVGLGIIAVFTILSFVIIFVVVGLKLALKKDEVEIVSLVGGSRWYIYRPFLVDSVFYGLVGAVIGWLGNVLVLLYSTPFLVWFLSGVPIFPIPWYFYVLLLVGEMLVGVSICLAASLVALRRYLPT